MLFAIKWLLSKLLLKISLLNGSPTISVQVINEVSNNLLKKLQFQESEISSFIVNCYERYSVVNISQETFIAASEIRINHQFSYYDSIIVASALINQCEVLYTEDMQDGKLIANSLKIINPFNDNNIN